MKYKTILVNYIPVDNFLMFSFANRENIYRFASVLLNNAKLLQLN